ncbi:hypothetical protein JXB31_01020 [Candidatus Woesearchaeota archaeon]|nr:hypothetical protein [Candidatus Woesearchaeota archaeon]
MARKNKAFKKYLDFFRKYVLVFGFLNGVWIAIGFNPKSEVLSLVSRFEHYLNPWIMVLFGILPTMLFLLIIYIVYDKARIWGLIAVLCGFSGGLFLLSYPLLSIVLVIIALLLSTIGIRRR